MPPDCSMDMALQGPDHLSATITGSPPNIPVGSYAKTPGHMMTDNLFLGIEHLPNSDGSIVPAIWDMYIDTNIRIEVDFDYGGYQPLANFTEYLSDYYPTGATKGMMYRILDNNRMQCTNNNHRDLIYTALTTGINQPPAPFSTTANTATFGSRFPLQQGTVYFNSGGLT